MKIESPAFQEGQPIPPVYTCKGRDISPELSISGAPAQAKSLALIMDDPDAPGGTWVHWVLYDVPPQTKSLPEALGKSQHVLNTAAQGLNDFGKLGYGGPCPPPGKPHRYFFKLYALSAALGLKPGASKADVEAAMQQGKVLAEASLMGTFAR